MFEVKRTDPVIPGYTGYSFLSFLSITFLVSSPKLSVKVNLMKDPSPMVKSQVNLPMKSPPYQIRLCWFRSRCKG